jgi:hypothetical protein
MAMNTSFTDNYDKSFLLDTMMGPNAMRITEEMANFLHISPGMRILDKISTGVFWVYLNSIHFFPPNNSVIGGYRVANSPPALLAQGESGTPSALVIFMIVSKRGFAPGESVLYRLSLLRPESLAS